MEMEKMDLMNKSTYYYDLPKELIAQSPVEPRDSSRLLVYHRDTKQIEHKIFRDIIDYLHEGDVLVINDTKVIPARLFGIKEGTGAHVEIFLLKRIDYTHWEVLCRPAKRLKVGTKVTFSDELSCQIEQELYEGKKIVRFDFDGVFEDILSRLGEMPLPPYIHKKLQNKDRYNTVYSKYEGSSAAPTAGLHFTTELLEKIKQKGVQIVEVLLHVGLGTFRPVSEDNILDHKMHSEYIEVTKEACDIINKAKKENRRVIAVGTTSIRTLESAAVDFGRIEPTKKETDIFIYPGYKFKIVDAVITNFHLPESTLIMLVAAFCGVQETLDMYKVAVKEKYRFFSFGDATFLC